MNLQEIELYIQLFFSFPILIMTNDSIELKVIDAMFDDIHKYSFAIIYKVKIFYYRSQSNQQKKEKNNKLTSISIL